jgi:hypothetical protein
MLALTDAALQIGAGEFHEFLLFCTRAGWSAIDAIGTFCFLHQEHAEHARAAASAIAPAAVVTSRSAW